MLLDDFNLCYSTRFDTFNYCDLLNEDLIIASNIVIHLVNIFINSSYLTNHTVFGAIAHLSSIMNASSGKWQGIILVDGPTPCRNPII